MKRRILDQYLFREGATAWIAVTIVLLSIMLATRFVRYLSAAAAGDLPRDVLFKVVALSSVQYLVILIPVSLLLGVMLALGRLYKDQEITALTTCGVGLSGLYRPFVGLALALAALTGLLAFQIGPWAGQQVDAIFKDARRLVQFTPFEPGQFKEVAGGRAVFYAEQMSGAAGDLSTVFIYVNDPKYASVVTAHSGRQQIDRRTGDREIQLEDGYRYAGEPGRADYDIAHFSRYTTRVSPPNLIYTPGKRKLASTADLLASGTREDWAELHWRIAAPVSVLLLVLLAVPLAHTSPRAGRYGKVVLGILAYLVYANLLGLGQAWITSGRVAPALGLWWVHGLCLVLAMTLIARRAGWLQRLRPA